MIWIRSPAWDSFWILGGLPIALVLILLGPSQMLLVFYFIVFLETGHTLSPIILAWAHSGFRQIMLKHKTKFILLPLTVFAVAIFIAVITTMGFTSYVDGKHHVFMITDWQNPLPVVIWVYLVWNAYHFGMQNYGVLSIYRRKRNMLAAQTAQGRGEEPKERLQRRTDLIFCLAMTCTAMATTMPVWFMHMPVVAWICIALSLTATCIMVWREVRQSISVPRLIFILTDGFGLALLWIHPLIGMAVYSINHWMVAIGLSSHVSPFRFWIFVGTLLLAGAIGFIWLTPTPNGNILRALPIVVCARAGLGFVHFLYDRWLWKFSNPDVRATIGKALFNTRGGYSLPASGGNAIQETALSSGS